MIHVTTLFVIYAAIVHLAVVMAAFAPVAQRKAALVCSSALLVSWMLHLSSWTAYAPEKALGMAPESMWALSNTVVAVIVMVMAQFTVWGPVLFGFLFAAVVNDAMSWMGFTNWKSFSSTADVIFLAEEATFFAIGGGSLYALLMSWVSGSDWLSRLRGKTGFLAS